MTKEELTKKTLEHVKHNTKEGWVLNPNQKVVNGIIKGLIRCDGECPCANDSEEKQCPCSNYRLHDHCCCTLYLKKEEAHKEYVKQIRQIMDMECATYSEKINMIADIIVNRL